MRVRIYQAESLGLRIADSKALEDYNDTENARLLLSTNTEETGESVYLSSKSSDSDLLIAT